MRVNTREAAELYGTTTKGLLKAMSEEGVLPFVIVERMDRGQNVRTYWWEPKDVLRVRGLRRKRELHRQSARMAALRAKRQLTRPPKVRDREEAARKFRETMKRKERRRILERIAARDGKDLPTLLQQAGLA